MKNNKFFDIALNPPEIEEYIQRMKDNDYCLDCGGFGEKMDTILSSKKCEYCIGTGKYSVSQKVKKMKAFL